jgi:hypothetical protein
MCGQAHFTLPKGCYPSGCPQHEEDNSGQENEGARLDWRQTAFPISAIVLIELLDFTLQYQCISPPVNIIATMRQHFFNFIVNANESFAYP